MLWVLKRTATMRLFFCVPKTYVINCLQRSSADNELDASMERAKDDIFFLGYKYVCFHSSPMRMKKKLNGVLTILRAKMLTPYFLVSSADNLCKQIGPRSGPTKCSGNSECKKMNSLPPSVVC